MYLNHTPWKNAGLFCEICGPRSKIMRPKLVKYAVFSHAFDTILGLVHIIKKPSLFNLYSLFDEVNLKFMNMMSFQFVFTN